MIQVAVRAWPASAVHDTVAAVLRTAAYQQSLQTTLLQRMLAWLAQGLSWLTTFLGGLPSGQTLATWFVGIVAALILARTLLAARARDPEAAARRGARGTRLGEDPWRAAERLAAAGDHEAAAHALYRGVLASLALHERLRLDPSKTSGDYVRELRARGAGSHTAFRTFARRFDSAIYGHGRVDAELTAELLRLAAPLRAGARAA